MADNKEENYLENYSHASNTHPIPVSGAIMNGNASMNRFNSAAQAESDSDKRQYAVPAQVRTEIFSYQRISNYYGEGSVATSIEDCRAAVEFLTFAGVQNPSLHMPTTISPSVDGGIALHWVNGECELFIKVSAEDVTELPYQSISPDGDFSVGTGTRESLIEKLSLIYPQ